MSSISSDYFKSSSTDSMEKLPNGLSMYKNRQRSNGEKAFAAVFADYPFTDLFCRSIGIYITDPSTELSSFLQSFTVSILIHFLICFQEISPQLNTP